jgi:RNA polymerase sigma factor (sigma-70 family)
MPATPKPAPEYLTGDEFWKTAEALLKTQKARIYCAARMFARELGPAVARLDAEDLLHETLLRFAAGDRKFKPTGDPVTLLIGGMKGVAYDTAKRKYTRDVEFDASVEFVKPSAPTPEDDLIARERREASQKIVEEIYRNDPEAKKVELLKAAGLSRKEIEKFLGITFHERDAARNRSERLKRNYRQKVLSAAAAS